MSASKQILSPVKLLYMFVCPFRFTLLSFVCGYTQTASEINTCSQDLLIQVFVNEISYSSLKFFDVMQLSLSKVGKCESIFISHVSSSFLPADLRLMLLGY